MGKEIDNDRRTQPVGWCKCGTGIAGFATLVVALGFLVAVLMSSAATAQGTSASCAGGVIPNSDVAISATDTSSGSNSSVGAYDMFNFAISLTDLDGMPSGCEATVGIPSQFYNIQDETLYLNSDGSYSTTEQADTVAVMQINGSNDATDPNTVTFTLTNYAATHTGVSVAGELNAQIGETVVRGQQQQITATVNGEAVNVATITGATCTTNCPTLPTSIEKWGTEDSNGSGSVTITTAAIPDTGTPVTITDTITDSSPDETIDGVQWIGGYNCADTWGSLGVQQPDGSCNTSESLPAGTCVNQMLSADGQSFSCTLTTTTPNEVFSMGLNMTFTGTGPWTDTAGSSYPGGPSQSVSATVATYSAGGGGTGTTPTTTTSVTTTTTGTTKPKPSFTVLKTATVSGPYHRGLKAALGDTVHYRIVVTNTGPISDTVHLDDSMFAARRLDCGHQDASDLKLSPGQKVACTVSHVVTATDLRSDRLVNIATITYHSRSGTKKKTSKVSTRLISTVSKVFEVDTDRETTQACADKVFRSMTLPYFHSRALVWTWTTWYGQQCFSGHFQIITASLPRSASSGAWIAAIDKRITVRAVGKVHTTRPLRHMGPGAVTIAFAVGPTGWLLGRPSSDQAPHVYFARS